MGQIARLRIKQIHLAGFEGTDDYLIDTHGKRVSDEVWSLYQFTLERMGPVPTVIEWDREIPDFSVLWNEAKTAESIIQGVST